MAALHLYHLSGLSTDTKPILEDALTGSTFEELDTQDIYVYSQNSKSWIKSKNKKSEPKEDKPLIGNQTCIGIKKISKTATEDLIDTYTIEYTNGTNQQFTVVNSPKILSVNQELPAEPVQENKLYNIEISASTDNPDETEIFNIYQPLVLNATETDGVITSDSLALATYWPRVNEGRFILHIDDTDDILFVYLGSFNNAKDYWQGYKLNNKGILVPYIGQFKTLLDAPSYYFSAEAQPPIDIEELKALIAAEQIARESADDRIETKLAGHECDTLNPHLTTILQTTDHNLLEHVYGPENVEQVIHDAKQNIDLEQVVNTGDTDQPIENSPLKFTSGGAYELQAGSQEALDQEIARAMTAEAVLDGKIDDEIARAEQTEAGLTAALEAESQRAQNAEQIIQDNLDAEISRAIAAEEILDDKITSEAARAINVENQIQDNLDTEISRALASEAVLQDNIDQEELRATNAEAILQENIDSEESRAIIAEAILEEAIEAEEDRAKQAEQTLTSNLNTEISDRQSADNTLQTNIDNETVARQNADSELNTRIDNLDLAQVGADGSYIKYVSQADGKVSASTAAFNTTIPNSNPSTINAPTTSAVKTYVDNADMTITNALNTHTSNKNNPHEVTVTQIHAVSYDANQDLDPTNKANARANIGLNQVENYPQDNDYKASSAQGSHKYFTVFGAANLYNEVVENETDVQAEIDQIGTVVGYQKAVDSETGEFIRANDHDNFNYVYELDPAGFVQQTKDLADQNKSRLDNLENNLTGLSVNNSGVTISDDLTVAGDLVVRGTTTTADQQTIQSESTIIVTNSTNAPLTEYAGTVTLKGNFEAHEVTAQTYQPDYFWYIDDTINDPTKRIIQVGGHKYVLDDSATYTPGRDYYSQAAEAVGLYDITEDAVLIGEGNYYGGIFEFDTKYSVISLNIHTYIPNKYYIKNQNDEYILATGDFDPNETYYLKINQGQHLATRADSNNLINEHLLAWDAVAYTLVDSGKSIAILENEHSQEVAARSAADTAIWTEIGTVSDPDNASTIYGYINRERTTRGNADTNIRNDFAAADAALAQQLTQAINNVNTTLTDNLDTEISRAVIAETILQDEIDQLAGGTQTSLADEIARATAAETLIQANLDDETERAIIAETILDDAIESETVRATGEEQNLNSAINTLNSTKSDKINTVTSVDYTTVDNVKKLTKTINGATSSIVDIETLKTDMSLNNLTNDRQIKGLASGTSENHILIFGTDGYTVKDSGKTLDDTGKIDSISIDGIAVPADVNKNVDLPPYPTQFTITANATDGLFNITGTSGSNSVTYEFAPYSTKQQIASFYDSAVDPTLTTRLNYDGYLYATKLYSKGSETITLSDIEAITTSEIEALFNN